MFTSFIVSSSLDLLVFLHHWAAEKHWPRKQKDSHSKIYSTYLFEALYYIEINYCLISILIIIALITDA